MNPQTDAASRRRSERVLLQIQVLLEIRRDDGAVVCTDAFTVSVNAHGGMLEASVMLPKGQKMSLINRATGAKVACEVVHVRKLQDAGFAIAFEFENPAPDFWPINLPLPGWQHLNTTK